MLGYCGWPLAVPLEWHLSSEGLSQKTIKVYGQVTESHLNVYIQLSWITLLMVFFKPGFLSQVFFKHWQLELCSVAKTCASSTILMTLWISNIYIYIEQINRAGSYTTISVRDPYILEQEPRKFEHEDVSNIIRCLCLRNYVLHEHL